MLHVDLDCLHYDNCSSFKKTIMQGVNTFARVLFRWEFDTQSVVLQKRFIKVVDTFLGRSSDSKIISCNLACCFSKSYPNKLEQWICSLGRLGIEQLTLKFMCTRFTIPYDYEVPPLFSCQLISEAPSLKSLTLIRCTLQPDLKNRCNNLKTLHLDKVNLDPGAMDCILSNCLNLESLMLLYCRVNDNKLHFCGPNLQLKDLIVFGCHYVNEVKFYANNLTTFEYSGVRLIEFSFDHVPKLEKFSIHLSGENIMRMLYGELSRALPWYKSLISEENYREMHTPTGINMFSNLRQLELGFFIFIADKLSVASVLDLCPLLEELNLVMVHADPQAVSVCCTYSGPEVTRKTSVKLHTHLKKVGFSGFSGTMFQQKVASYILRSAMALEQMHISLYYTYFLGQGMWAMCRIPCDEDKRERIRQTFQGDAISKRANITISHKQWAGEEDVCVVDDFYSSFPSFK